MLNFGQLLQRLTDAGLEFVLVGGFAAVSHGSFNVTRDVDICAVLTEENVAKLRQALKDWNPTHRMTPQKLSFLLYPPAGESVNNLCLQTDKGMVNILTSIKGVGDFQRLNAAAEEILVDGQKIRVIALNDLIKAKEAMGRERDLMTAKELRAIAAKREAAKK
ncbi:MAG TPA: nucleotidyltransferase [Lacunisphaera sp.]